MRHSNIITVALSLFSTTVYSQSLSVTVISSITSTLTIPGITTTEITLPVVSVSVVPVPVPVPTPEIIYLTDPECPAANGSYYLSEFDAEFRIACPFPNAKAKRQDIVDAYISRFSDCIEVCDPSTECLGMLFDPKTLACAGYKCQPAPLNNQWAADMTAKGGVSIEATSCGGDQDSQLIFNVENALLNQANTKTTPTPTPTPTTTQTTVTLPATSPEPVVTTQSSTPSATPTSTSTVTSIARTTISTSAPSKVSSSSSSTYTPAVVQTNAANPVVLPKILAGVAAALPLFGF